METTIKTEDLKVFQNEFKSNEHFRCVMNEVVDIGLEKCLRRKYIEDEEFFFSLSLPQEPVTDQKKSGRCWIHAALSFIRSIMTEKRDINFSHNFIAFYDLLEKSNFFLELVFETLSENAEDRLLSHIFTAPIQDTGQWDMFVNIVNKYGLTTESAMPETKSSEDTAVLINILSEQLRAFACSIRKQYKNGYFSTDDLKTKKRQMLSVIYRILCIGLGCPPTIFNFSDKEITPLEFYNSNFKKKLDTGYTSVIHYPLRDKPFYKFYEIMHIGNVKEGCKVKYLNLPLDLIKELIVSQFQAGQSVWFGCDARRFVDRDAGIFDLRIEDFPNLLGTDFELNKTDALIYRSSFMTHAMLLKGVNLNGEGKPNRWFVQNSYGSKIGKNGYFAMSDEWFERYVFQAVISNTFIKTEWIKNCNTTPLNPWDSMGMLALSK